MAEAPVTSVHSDATALGLIVSAEEIRQGIVDSKLPPWAQDTFHAFQNDLLSTERLFPCIFGVEALKQDNLRFVFLEDPYHDESLYTLKNSLVEYTGIYRSLSRMTSLVALFKPQAAIKPIEEYRQDFWHVIQFLHEHDPALWPVDIPIDTQEALWEFCFNGDPMFVVCNTPAHTQRRSRSSKGFMITFQPRWVFEGLGNTPKGEKARRSIRERIVKYDTITPYPGLGAYGDPNNNEWKQYFLPDDNSTEFTECPFKH
ncbi:MAG TPA: YqcI/YcgG family protein [Herpetosiphonaceae bacterium]